LPNQDEDIGVVVPIPGEDNDAERERIRSSNDRDQALERAGKVTRHNQGYDQAADGKAIEPTIDRIVDE
jgi:hypothetical protein